MTVSSFQGNGWSQPIVQTCALYFPGYVRHILAILCFKFKEVLFWNLQFYDVMACLRLK